MPMLPYIALWFLLLAAAVLSRVIAGRGRLVGSIAPVALTLAGIVWLLAAPSEPVSATLAGWSWLVDDAAWQLTGIALLLALAGALSSAAAGWLETTQTAAPISNAAIPALTAAALPVLWAGDVRTMAAGYALLLGAWLLVARAGGDTGAPFRGRAEAAVLAAPVLLVWLAAALSGRLGGGAWSALALLGAGLVASGAFPGGAWRQRISSDRPQTAALLMGLPVLAGGKFLLPLAQPGALSGTVLAIGTVAGLVALLMAVRSLFSNESSLAGLAMSAAAALAGLVLLAALWAGPDGLLAQLRVAVLAPAVLLLLSAVRTTADAPSERVNGLIGSSVVLRAAVGFVLATMAAVPLTAGFRGLGSVYGTWLGAGGWPLLLVTTLLMTLLLVALVVRGWLVLADLRLEHGRSGWLAVVPAVLLGAGLLAWPWPWVAEISPFAWSAILLPPAIGVVATVFLGRHDAGAELLATTVPTLPAMWRESRVGGPVAAAGRLMGDAAADALAILEGPYGLLWVLALLTLFALLA